MTIAAILAGKGAGVFSIAPEETMARAVAMLAERRIGAVPVVEDGRVLGVFSERDVIRCLHAEDGAAALAKPVREAMTAPAVIVTPGDSVIGALSLMTQRRIRHLPVVTEGRLVGFVSIGDLVKHRIDRIEADAEAMRAYIQQA